MAQFPRTEAEIAELARLVASGLEQNTDVYPEPPVAPAELHAALARFHEAHHEVLAAEFRLKELYGAKRAALAEVVDLTKTELRYAEYTVRYDDVALMGLGWGGRRKRRRLEPPGQVMGFEIVRQERDSVALAWNKPTDGGRPAAYRIECCRAGEKAWREAGSAVHTRVTLYNQERGVQLAYRVIAFNRAGEGQESAIAEAVL